MIKNHLDRHEVSLLILPSLFLLVTIFSTSKLTSQVKLIAEHPFTVNGDISDVKTNLALMRSGGRAAAIL